MASAPTRVLAFPVKPDLQLSAFPFGSPDTLTLHSARCHARLSGLAPYLAPNECIRLLAEIALVEQQLDALEFVAKARVERQARHFGIA